MKKLLLISSGGGHLQELMQLKPMFDKYEVMVVSEKTETTKFISKEFKRYAYLLYGTKEHLLAYLFIFPINIIKSLFIYLSFKPDVVITTGTHTAVPMCKIAHMLHSKVIWIETFANAKTPTKAGKMVYKDADLFLVQWEEMLSVYPNAKYWGNLF